MKKCSRCALSKPDTDYAIRSDNGGRRRGTCKSCQATSAKPWVRLNRDKVNSYYRAYHFKNREKRKADYLKNRAKVLRQSAKYYQENKERVHQRARIRRRKEPNFRLMCVLRLQLNLALRGKRKAARAISLLGCSISDFKLYLESKFEPGMSWENYGLRGWHIDHIMPCAIFDLTKPEHQKRCFHFSNLQPLWATENMSKGKRVLSDQFNLL